MKRWQIILAGYVTIAVVTFGHAAANREDWYQANCAGTILGSPLKRECLLLVDSSGVGIAAGFLWPLYWSWEAWS